MSTIRLRIRFYEVAITVKYMIIISIVLLFLSEKVSSIFPESSPALLCTIDSMLITACNSTSLATRGHFKGLCIRFTDGMGTDPKFWAPNLNQEYIMNSCMSN